jgi:hypothetical protein
MDHAGSIVHIEYDQQNKIFITMGQDSAIQIQKHLLGVATENRSSAHTNANENHFKLNKNQAKDKS